MTLKNNFKTYQKDFSNDTGLPFNTETLNFYLQYYAARCADANGQILGEILNYIKNPTTPVKHS